MVIRVVKKRQLRMVISVDKIKLFLVVIKVVKKGQF